MENPINSEQQVPEIENGIEERFKNSKVRNQDGTLMKVYHYSDDDIQEFSLEHVGKNYAGDKGFFGSGIYFTDSANSFDYGRKKYAAYLNLKNPLIVRNPTVEDVRKLHGTKEELQSQGYDGVMVWNDAIADETKTIFGEEEVIKGSPAGWSEICVFDPDDIQQLDVTENS